MHFLHITDQQTLNDVSYMSIVYEYISLAIGAFLFALRLPERLWPGKFDIFVS